jgi:hypothetical protein
VDWLAQPQNWYWITLGNKYIIEIWGRDFPRRFVAGEIGMKRNLFLIYLPLNMALAMVLGTAGCTAPKASTATPPAQPNILPANAIPTNAALEQQTTTYAKSQADAFSAAYNVSVDASRAVGLDAALVGGESGQLASTMAPVKSPDQHYRDWLVYGYLSINHPSLAEHTKLAMEAYLIACVPEKQDCWAVPVKGDPIPIDPALITLEKLPTPVEIPIAAYEQGSIGGCFYVLGVKICVKVF